MREVRNCCVRPASDVLAREAETARQESRRVKQGQSPATRMGPALAGVRIIVVEQNADIRDLLDQVLSLWGARVTPVMCARDAVARVSEADIIVTDVAMGTEDGVWLWEQVNLQPRPIPVIAVTGYSADQYPRMKHAQFARTFLKPVDPEKLAGVIREVLDGR